MRLKLLYTLLLSGAGFFSLFAQTINPLGGYDFPRTGKPAPAVPKMACGGFDLSAFELVRPGETAEVAVGLDTFDLGDGLVYNCVNCNEAAFGTPVFAADTLVYTANTGVEEGIDELRFVVCDADNNCSPEVVVSVLVQRAGTTVNLGGQDIGPGETIDIDVPLGNLPDETFCRTVETCNADYTGREQRVFFQFGINGSNEIRYVGARAGGTDQICVTICTELGLCDAFTASVTVTRETLTLPFFDDFSYAGFRPDARLWENEDVLVNRNFGVLPPSIGVATFDGVDADGRSYTDVSGTGPTRPRDYLTSGPINMINQTGTVLNFYAQPRGLGNRPERQDSLIVEFRDEDGSWRQVFGIQGRLNTEGNDVEMPFVAYSVNVPNTEDFLYNGFQFRFFNKSNERGAADMWHVDYVKLDDQSTTAVTQDLALVQEPEVLLEPYTSLPLRHYQAVGAGLLRDSITLALFNHRADVTPITTGNISVRLSDGSAVTGASGGLIAGNLFPGGTGVQPETLDVRRADLMGWNGFNPLVDFLAGLDEDQSVKIFNQYALTILTEDTGFSPFVFTNSNVSTPTCFDEYLAYDDGSAEATLEIDPGGTILQAYDTYVNDELVGVQVSLPQGLGALGDQLLRLVVYAGDTMPEELIYEEDFDILRPEDFAFDSLQGFTTYTFEDRLELPAGRYFIGWEQLSANRNVGIGFDRNNRPEGIQWFSGSAGFEPLRGTTTGAIMLRPLLSGFEGFQTDTEEAYAAEARLTVFPVPTSSTLHLRPRPGYTTDNATFRLFSVAGALVASGPAPRQLDLTDLPAGVYLLEYTAGNHRERHKIVRR